MGHSPSSRSSARGSTNTEWAFHLSFGACLSGWVYPLRVAASQPRSSLTLACRKVNEDETRSGGKEGLLGEALAGLGLVCLRNMPVGVAQRQGTTDLHQQQQTRTGEQATMLLAQMDFCHSPVAVLLRGSWGCEGGAFRGRRVDGEMQWLVCRPCRPMRLAFWLLPSHPNFRGSSVGVAWGNPCSNSLFFGKMRFRSPMITHLIRPPANHGRYNPSGA